MQDDLKKIKDKYGEKMSHLCRELFPTILENEGLLISLLEDNFAYSRLLYGDIKKNNLVNDFKNYIYSLTDIKKEEITINKTPEELMKEVGYDLFECKSEECIQKFRKYYAENEVLCTFKGNRLDRCYVFFAVKKNVDEIKRENFDNPEREDEYGTSVISIQFTKGEVNTLSIKNRYNHSVNNPDATYSNNLENIVPGLTKSFENEYDLNINYDKLNFEIPGYIRANDKKYYKYNYEINNIYYCPDNIIIDHFEVINDYQDKSRYIIIDYFILDLSEKKIRLYDYEINDSFVDGLENIKKIYITKDADNKYLTINNDVVISLDKTNKIIDYKNNDIKKIDNNFLIYNNGLNNLILDNLNEIGDNFLQFNKIIKEINFPKLIKVGNNFLPYNERLNVLNTSCLEIVGNDFLYSNNSLEEVNLINLKMINDNFFFKNNSVFSIYLPSVISVGDDFFNCNNKLNYLSMINVKKIGNNFLRNNGVLKRLTMPNLKQVGNYFFIYNSSISHVFLPNLENVGHSFFHCNNVLEYLNLSSLNRVGKYFLRNNHSLKVLIVPNLESAEEDFLYHNESLRIMISPNIKYYENVFLNKNKLLSFQYKNK